MMDDTAQIIETFGLVSLSIAFAKYTLARKKINAENNMKNHTLNNRLLHKRQPLKTHFSI